MFETLNLFDYVVWYSLRLSSTTNLYNHIDSRRSSVQNFDSYADVRNVFINSSLAYRSEVGFSIHAGAYVCSMLYITQK